MNLKFGYHNNILIVAPKGALDHHSLEQNKNLTDRHFKFKNSRNIIFDLAGVTFIDSSGIGYIIGRYKLSLFSGGKTAFINVNDSVIKILRVSGLLKIIKIYPTMDAAIRALEQGGVINEKY